MGLDATELVTILAPLVEMEKQAASCASLEEYHALRQSGEATNAQVLDEIRAVVTQSNPSLPELRELYYGVLRSPVYAGDPETQVNVTAILNEAFKGVAGWQR
ncbi:MAG: hypothetical protein ABF824_13790 [Acetobacter sp.]